MIPIDFLFYREHWINRLLSRNRFGHVNLRLPSGLYVNMSRFPELCGVLDTYPDPPDWAITIECNNSNVLRALEYSEAPTSILSIYQRNCAKAAALAIWGDETRTDLLRKLISDYCQGSPSVAGASHLT